LESNEFGLPIWLGALGGSQVSTGKEDFPGVSAVLPTLSEALDIELSDFEAEDATRKGDYLWQEAEIVIRVVPTVLEVRFICLFMSVGRILLQGSVSANMFAPMRHQVDLRKVKVGISFLVNTYLMADIIMPSVHFAPLHGRRPCFTICFLLYLSLLQEFRSQGIRFGLNLFAGSPE